MVPPKMPPRKTRPRNPVVFRQTVDERPKADHPRERGLIVEGGWAWVRRVEVVKVAGEGGNVKPLKLR